jgi:hypothetical protein
LEAHVAKAGGVLAVPRLALSLKLSLSVFKKPPDRLIS